MSQRDVERALGRLLTDHAFRSDFFFEDASQACLPLGLQLTPQELDALLRTSPVMLANLGERLDDWICRLHTSKPKMPMPGD